MNQITTTARYADGIDQGGTAPLALPIIHHLPDGSDIVLAMIDEATFGISVDGTLVWSRDYTVHNVGADE